MKPVRLYPDANGIFADESITITGLKSWITSPEKTIQINGKTYTSKVFNGIQFHCTVKNTGRFLARLTLIVTLCDDKGYNIGSASDSILCFEKGELWEAYGNTNITDYSPDSSGAEGKTRSYDIINSQRRMKVFVIEEDELGSLEDLSGALGSTG